MPRTVFISGILSGNFPAGKTKTLANNSPTEITETDFEQTENVVNTIPSQLSVSLSHNFLIFPLTLASRAKLPQKNVFTKNAA